MATITLTVTSKNGATVSSVSQIFDSADMIGVVASGSGAKFKVEEGNDFPTDYTVSESLSAIQSAIAAIGDVSTLAVDTITENTPANGVTVDGVAIKDGGITTTIPNVYALGTTISAGATQTQAGATLLTKEYNNVTTVTTANDGVRLPTAAAGLVITVKNAGANAMKVYPFSGDSIDDEAADAAVIMPVESVVRFVAISTSVWQSDMENISATIASTDTISEKTAAAGVTIDGVLLKDSQVTTDQINEKTGAAGVTIDGVLLKDSTVKSDTIIEKTADAGVTADGVLHLNGVVVGKATPVAINTTATATAAQMASGYITSTSAAAVAITTPTATAIAAVIGAVAGTTYDFVIDNSAGANTVTLTLDGSIAVVTPAITGGATLTVSTANAIGVFRLVFTSGTAAKIFRIG